MKNILKIPALFAVLCLSAAAAVEAADDLFCHLRLPVCAQETEPQTETTARTTPSAIPPTTTQSTPAPAAAEPEEAPVKEPAAVIADAEVLAAVYEAVNLQRSNAGSEALAVDSMLCDIAVQRISEFSHYPETKVIPCSRNALSSETVVRGLADPNTALSSILLDTVQKNNLVYSGYTKIGIAVSADSCIWVLLLSA